MSRYIVFFHPGDTVPDRMKYIDDASDAPDANDDAATLGVTVGSLWLDTTNHAVYICEDASTGAAVWTELTGGGSVAAGDVSVVDSGGYFTGTDVEAVLAELAVADTDPSSLNVDLSVSGATTVDRADGATHDLTLTGNATITLDGAVTGEATDWRLIIRQDGTGSRLITWADTITWVGGSAPTLQTDPDAVDTIGLLTVDDGTTYLGYHAGAGGSAGTPATTVESETTFGISAAVGTDTEYARQDHTHGTPANPVTAAAVEAVGRWEVLLIEDGSEPLTTEDGLDWLYVWVTTDG